MGIGNLPGFAVLVREGANLGVVAHQMAQLVDTVGHVPDAAAPRSPACQNETQG